MATTALDLGPLQLENEHRPPPPMNIIQLIASAVKHFVLFFSLRLNECLNRRIGDMENKENEQHDGPMWRWRGPRNIRELT
jgi:hypothetical protein